MKYPESNSSKFVLIHLLFWVGVWFFFVYFFSYNSENSDYVTWFSSFLLPVTMATTYFTVYFLLPRYLLQKKYKLFLLYGIYTVVVSAYLIVVSIFACFIFLTDLEIAQIPPMGRNYIFVLILVYLVVGLVSFVKILSENFIKEAKNKELENKILEADLQLKKQELDYLKKQIHPHFLFNSLNTIYGLALSKNESTPDVIMKLSNLLDYILYQVGKPSVSLVSEANHIEEYIALESLRFRDTLDVNFNKDKLPEGIQIAPMLLIPFVENAFKHGKIIDGKLSVKVDVGMRNGNLRLFVSNTWNEGLKKNDQGGIGLYNIQKRLDLLYRNNYSLKVNPDKEKFEVELIVENLEKHDS